MAAATTVAGGGTSADWARKYPPLLALGVGLLIALTVLPSSLNLPQSNPTETLEYAPVPPDSDAQSGGNTNSLGLGTSSGLEGGGASGAGEGGGPEDAQSPLLGPGVPPPKGRGGNPSVYRCVGNPPRQTEDPQAPPCVPYFEGDNFGATYQGVTGDEIRLLIYLDGGINYISGSDGGTDNVAPSGVYYDLFQAPDPDEPEHLLVRGMRGWQTYFNDRFQTYNRRVHFFVYLSGWSTPRTPENRKADAADNYLKIKPFAVLSGSTEGAEDDYLEAMAKKGVLNFGSFGVRPESFFQRYPKLIWGFQPSIQVEVDEYAKYVFKKVVNQNSVLAGGTLNNRARKIGMVRTSDKNWPGLVQAADLLKQRVQECGGQIAQESIFKTCCLAQDNSEASEGRTDTQEAAADMATFQREGVTTILWPGGISGNYGKAAQALGYAPEWVLMGDRVMEGNNPQRLAQNTAVFDGRAVIVTPEVYTPALEQQRCFQAYREADQELSKPNVNYVCEYYRNLFQLFTGIQVAGPRLGPTSIDKGFHAIPDLPSKGPETPACFYNPGDYTCVKDAQVEIWDAQGAPPGDNRPGCWRAIEGGRRYLRGEWPAGNINAQLTGSEPCNGYSAAVRYNIA